MTYTSLPQGGARWDKGAGTSFWLLTDLFTFKVLGTQTDGRFSIAEVTAGPEMGPPPHVHANADESFYILEGTYEFMLAGETFRAEAGEFVYLPKNVVHTHRSAPGTFARALVLQTPAGVERFIEEAGKPATDPSQRPAAPELSELQRIVEIAQKHGISVPQA